MLTKNSLFTPFTQKLQILLHIHNNPLYVLNHVEERVEKEETFKKKEFINLKFKIFDWTSDISSHKVWCPYKGSLYKLLCEKST
jgi:hypothetical protein